MPLLWDCYRGLMARTPNRSEPTQVTISVPAQTHAYLVKLATVGALGHYESQIAAQIVIAEVERLMTAKRAETLLAAPVVQPSPDDKG